MQNENKHLHWKQKLADTESLSAELRLNKNAAWEKLQHRLHQKPKRRKAIWYWVAAACLLPIIVFISSTLLQRNNTVAINTAGQPATIKEEVRKEKPLQRDLNSLALSTSVLKKKSVIKRNVNNVNNDFAPVIIEEKKNDVIIDSVINNPVEIASVRVDSINEMPLVIQTKKKLKVVHINELGEAAEASPYLVHNVLPRSFPLQIAREESYGSSQSTYKNAFTGFTGKSPSN